MGSAGPSPPCFPPAMFQFIPCQMTGQMGVMSWSILGAILHTENLAPYANTGPSSNSGTCCKKTPLPADLSLQRDRLRGVFHLPQSRACGAAGQRSRTSGHWMPVRPGCRTPSGAKFVCGINPSRAGDARSVEQRVRGKAVWEEDKVPGAAWLGDI